MDWQTAVRVMTGIGAAAKTAKPAVEMSMELVGRVLTPSADTLGQGLAAPLQEWKRKRQQRAEGILADAAKKLVEKGIEPTPVPPALLIPILEHSSLVEEEELQRKWATLLANAGVADNKVLPAFAEILRQLTPVHAKIIDYMRGVPGEVLEKRVRSHGEVHRNTLVGWLNLGANAIDVLFSDLERLQIVEVVIEQPLRIGDSLGHLATKVQQIAWSIDFKDRFRFSPLGREFVGACYEVKGQDR